MSSGCECKAMPKNRLMIEFESICGFQSIRENEQAVDIDNQYRYLKMKALQTSPQKD
jgi:hypothetical protein